MRRVAVLLFALMLVAPATLGAAPPGSSEQQSASRPALKLATKQPITVRGLRFEARESVRVTLSGVANRERSSRAGQAGTFVVRFEGVTATRCDLIRVVAVGAEGSRAILKILPSPACQPS